MLHGLDFLPIRIERSVKWHILYPLASFSVPVGTTIKTVHTPSARIVNRIVLSVESATHCFGLSRAILIQERSNQLHVTGTFLSHATIMSHAIEFAPSS